MQVKEMIPGWTLLAAPDDLWHLSRGGWAARGCKGGSQERGRDALLCLRASADEAARTFWEIWLVCRRASGKKEEEIFITRRTQNSIFLEREEEEELFLQEARLRTSPFLWNYWLFEEVVKGKVKETVCKSLIMRGWGRWGGGNEVVKYKETQATKQKITHSHGEKLKLTRLKYRTKSANISRN